MGRAIAVARENPAAPFGAVIVDADCDRELARGVNRSREEPTLHAELVAIRGLYASGAAPHRGQLSLYTTAEPCPMCAAACFWAGIRRVVFGISIPWLSQHGWRQIGIRAADIFAAADAGVELMGGVLEDECARLFSASCQRGETA
jgi:tRNA(Arg) A34 adenosine deaminase TadA